MHALRNVGRVRDTGTATLSSRQRLRPYVAGLAVEWLHESPHTRHRRITGSLVFVDISGFTTLTERLAIRGKVGAEEMSDLLNASFATLLEDAYSYGASLVKWGGDAVLLLFEDAEHAELACRAAYEMRRTMRRIGRLRTSVGVVQLKMSVGVNSGEFDFFLTGRRHRELLVAGPAATETAVMEQTAEAGEIVVSPATAALLPPACVGAPKEGGLLLRSAPRVDQRSRYWTTSAGEVDLGSCVDPAIRDHLLTEVGDSEHRQVAVGFVEVSGVDDLLVRQGPGAVASALHDLVSLVQEQCERHRVTFWETDISKDGFKIMLVAGAPRSSGHDEEGMLRASRTILDQYDGPVRVRIGVNSGRVFNGGFGPPFRRTWSVKGDAINLAARVMGKAGTGQLLATETLLRRVNSGVDAELLPPFLVKGKQHPVQAAVVRAVSDDRVTGPVDAGTFVGRRASMDALMVAARAAVAGHGSAVAVTGEPGIGKSRLVDHACRRLDPGTAVLRGFADSYQSATPYYAVRRLLRAAIGAGADAEAEQVVTTLRSCAAAAAPRLNPWLPLLAVPFGVDLPDTSETAAVQEQFRRPKTLSLVVELLTAMLTTPTVVVVDDLQDADDASAELLAKLATASAQRPWLVLLVGRELPVGLRDDGLVGEVALPPLAVDESEALVLEVPGGEALAPHVIRGIVERGEGNPLFLRELTRAVSRSEGEELPSTLEDLLAAQIDELAPGARKLLRAVSVLGSRFDEGLAAEMVDVAPTPDQWRALGHFLAQHGDGSWRFRTRLARDAAYEGLPFRRRVDLHGRAATALEQRATVDDDRAEALSLHCLSAQRYNDAWRHSRVAGERAGRVYANVEALTFFGRARLAARRLPDLPSSDVAQLLETIGDLHARHADLDAAQRSYAEARRLAAPEDGVTRGRISLDLALVCARAGKLSRALRWLSVAARDVAQAATGPPTAASEVHARALVERALIRCRQGKYREAAALAAAGQAEAEAVAAHRVVGRALWVADLTDLSATGKGDEPRVRRALSLFEQVGDLTFQAHMWIQLGMHSYYLGDWNTAVERYGQARELHVRTGDDWNAAIPAANVAEILVDQGRYDEAEPMAREALRIWRVSGTPWDLGFGAALLARLCMRTGRFGEAAALLSEALDAFSSSNDRLELLDAQLRVVEMFVLQGAAAEAWRRLAEIEPQLGGASSADESQAAGTDLPQRAQLHRLRGYTLGQLGDIASATESFVRAVELARSRAARHEVALGLDGLCWLGPDDLAVAERDELHRQLGVVSTPIPPRQAGEVAASVVALPRQREETVPAARV